MNFKNDVERFFSCLQSVKYEMTNDTNDKRSTSCHKSRSSVSSSISLVKPREEQKLVELETRLRRRQEKDGFKSCTAGTETYRRTRIRYRYIEFKCHKVICYTDSIDSDYDYEMYHTKTISSQSCISMCKSKLRFRLVNPKEINYQYTNPYFQRKSVVQ